MILRMKTQVGKMKKEVELCIKTNGTRRRLAIDGLIVRKCRFWKRKGLNEG